MKRGLINWNELAVRFCDSRCTAWAAIDQRHLPQDPSGPDRLDYTYPGAGEYTDISFVSAGQHSLPLVRARWLVRRAIAKPQGQVLRLRNVAHVTKWPQMITRSAYYGLSGHRSGVVR